MPFSRQILSKSTSVSFRPKRPVKTLPLSVRISSGTPWRSRAWAKKPQTGRAVARTMIPAQTQKRLWSSTPVSTLHSVPSSKSTPPTTSICHSSIGRPRSQRL